VESLSLEMIYDYKAGALHLPYNTLRLNAIILYRKANVKYK